MHRRDFIAGVGFVALGSVGIGRAAAEIGQPGASTARPLAPSAPLAPPAPPLPRTLRTLRKAVMIGMVADPAAKSLAEKFQLLRDCGFEGVEMDWPSPTPVAEMLAAQEKTGLKIHGLVDSVHWKHPLNHGAASERRKGLDALTDCLRTAKVVGASTVLLVPGIVNADHPYDDCWRVSREQIALALPVAQEMGVTIAVENVWNGFLLSPIEAAAYVDSFASPHLRFHFDIGNIINAGWPDQWVRILGARTVKLHLKDFSRRKRDDAGLWKGFDVELGEGDAQWERVMEALDATGYSTFTGLRAGEAGGNWATAEVRGGDRTRLKQVAEQMDRLIARRG